MLPQAPEEVVRFATGWTDDMFMVSSVLSRIGSGAHAATVGRLLTTYAGKLQRPDGISSTRMDGPHAWGRGNGFALLGVTEALTYLPQGWSDRARVLEIYRKHVAALAKLQSDDGSWRQVVDEPASYRELTVTAMTTAAMARGVRLGWIDRSSIEPVIDRGWNAVAVARERGRHRQGCVLGNRSGTDQGVLPQSSGGERLRRSRRRDGATGRDRGGNVTARWELEVTCQLRDGVFCRIGPRGADCVSR